MQAPNSSIHYQINLTSTTGHLLNVNLYIEHPDSIGQILSLPAWIPGSYMIRDFAKNILWLNAFDGNKQKLDVVKLDKQTWQVSPCDGALHIEYQIYAFDLSVRGAYINDEFAFFNGTNVFLAVAGQTQSPSLVSLEKPTCDKLMHWRVATTLPTEDTNKHQFGQYWASNYEELIDHPVLFGEFDIVPFEVQEVEFELILAGGHQADVERITRDLSKICQHHLTFFDGASPVERYLFITLLTDNSFGGLEHLSSTALMYSRGDLPSLSDSADMADGYQVFLSLCSHEFFHTWHVKRIQPEELFHAPLDSEQYTEQLWIYEGFTSYYDDLSLLRADLITQQQYLKVGAQNLTRLIRNKGRFKQSVTESSFDAWSKFYKQDEGAINNIVSYYNKGAVLAMCLDLLIRNKSQGEHSLDTVMQCLWKQHGQTSTPTTKNSVQGIIEKQLNLDLKEFFELALYSTQELPFVELLNKFGVQVSFSARESLTDKGGEANKSPFKIEFGAQIKAREIGAEVRQVTEGTAAYEAGLQVGDVLIAIDQWQVTEKNLKNQLNNLREGQISTLTILRDKRLKQLKFTARSAEKDTISLSVVNQNQSKNWLS